MFLNAYSFAPTHVSVINYNVLCVRLIFPLISAGRFLASALSIHTSAIVISAT